MKTWIQEHCEVLVSGVLLAYLAWFIIAKLRG